MEEQGGGVQGGGSRVGGGKGRGRGGRARDRGRTGNSGGVTEMGIVPRLPESISLQSFSFVSCDLMTIQVGSKHCCNQK